MGRQEGDPTREQKPQSLTRAGVAGGADGTLLAVHLLRVPPPASAFRWRRPTPPFCPAWCCLDAPQGCQSTWVPTRDWGRKGLPGATQGAACPHEKVRLTLRAVGTMSWGLGLVLRAVEVRGQPSWSHQGRRPQEAEMGNPQGHAYLGASKETLRKPCAMVQTEKCSLFLHIPSLP